MDFSNSEVCATSQECVSLNSEGDRKPEVPGRSGGILNRVSSRLKMK